MSRPLKRLNSNNLQRQGKNSNNVLSKPKYPNFLDALNAYKKCRNVNKHNIPSTSKDNQENQKTFKNDYQSVTIISDDDLEDGEIIEDKVSHFASLIAESFTELKRSKKIIQRINSPESATKNQSVFYVDKSAENGNAEVPLYTSLSDISADVMDVDDSVICVDTTQSCSDESVIIIDDKPDNACVNNFISLSPIKQLSGLSPEKPGTRRDRQKERFRVYKQKKMVEKVIELQSNGLLDGMPIKIPSVSNTSTPQNKCSIQASTSQTIDLMTPPSRINREKRIILIDGSNVALSYTASEVGKNAMIKSHKEFSAEALKKVITHFENKDFQVKAIVPEFRVRREKSSNHELMIEMMDNGKLVTTPSKAYDDLILLQSAAKLDAAIVSNDLFRDVRNTKSEFKEVIEKRQIRYNWVFGELILAEDPNGRSGPKLDDILFKST